MVVDTSVWIDVLNGREDDKAQFLLRYDDPDSIVVGDLILMEVLQGARSEERAAFLDGQLRRFNIAPMLGPELARKAALNYRTLRRKGLTVRRSTDMIIGTFCIENDLPLLHKDRDFDAMQTHLGLKCL